VSRPKRPSDLRARSILERLSGSSEALDDLDQLAEGSETLAERLKEIEQLFVLHGGERRNQDVASRQILFSWGHLQVLERIGEGSFGEVFLAYDDILDRDVALKLLKTGQQRPFQSQLFLHEARQLALVRHPNVLAVHGAAIHEGRPGLWCDLIDGNTLSELDPQRADFTKGDWLALIESLALGLRAVHDAGLLHGDVKPSNIMQDHSGQWVLMDFGASLDRSPDAAGTAMASGTPLYMAPEAVLGRSPSTASDVYSLGATLLRVSTGRPVQAAKDWKALREMHRRAVPIDAKDLERALGRPLARLVASMLDHDPEARPRLDAILASIESMRSAPQRRFRRIAIGAITASLLLGLIFTSWGLIQANQSRLVAEQEQRNTAAVNQFLQRLLSSPNESGQARNMTVEQMLDQAAGDVQEQLAGQHEAQAAVHLALAESYDLLDQAEQALEQVELGLNQLDATDPLNPLIRPKLELEAIAALQSAQENEQSLARAKQFEVTFRNQLPPNSDLFKLARRLQISNLLSLNRFSEAERLLDRYFQTVPEPEQATNNLGFLILHARANVYRELGRYDEAVAVAQDMLDWLARHPRDRLMNRVNAKTVLATNLYFANRKREALPVQNSVVALNEQLFGANSAPVFDSLNSLAAFYHDLGQLDHAMATQDRAFALIDNNAALAERRELLSLQGNRANLLNARGQYDEGEALIRQLMKTVKERLGDRNTHYLLFSYNLTELLNIRARFDEALPLAASTTQAVQEVLGEGHPLVWLSEANRAQSLAGLGRADEALALHDEASRAVIDAMGPDHHYSLTVRRQAMESRERLAPGSVPEAEIRDLIEAYTTQTSAEHPDTRKAQALLDGLN